MRYRLHRDLVLRGIDLKIPSRSKLAFCGRTGCGKSSLFSVLPCLAMSCSGKVFGMKKEQLLSAVGCNMLSQLSHCGILRASGHMRQLSLLGYILPPPGENKTFFGFWSCDQSRISRGSVTYALCLQPGVLNRLYPLASGRVLIDGIDISTLPLRTLRAKVRVVSQESFLISGSLRQNLTMGTEGSEANGAGAASDAADVFGGASGVSGVSDEVLWYCLRVVGLEEKVRQLPETLDFTVDVAGQNFSVGERQLITLARVLVPSRPCSLADWAPPRILLCDEATANIDVLTDEKAR